MENSLINLKWKPLLAICLIFTIGLVGCNEDKKDPTPTPTPTPTLSQEADLLTFALKDINNEFMIDKATSAVTNEEPLAFGVDVTKGVATFTASAKATVTVGNVAQVSGETANDFTSPVTYTVTAEDGKTSTNFTVTVNISATAWGQVATAAFVNMERPSAFVHNNKLWLLGAVNVGVDQTDFENPNPGEYYEYVYSSADGASWDIVYNNTVGANDSVPFGTHSSATAYNGNLITVGGLSGYYPGGFSLARTVLSMSVSSDDGATWTYEEESKLPEGANFKLLKANDKLYTVGYQSIVFGALQAVSSMDIYYKPTAATAWDTVAINVLDGLLTTSTNPTFYATVYFNGEMYIAGGVSGASFITSTLDRYSKSVYKSTDGATWSVATADGFPQLAGSQIVAYKNKLYAIAGARGTADNSDKVYTREVYVSEDGVTWTLLTGALALPEEFEGRAFHNAVVMNDKIYIIGGENKEGDGIGDVWVGEFVN